MSKDMVGHKITLTEARLKAPPSDQLVRYTHAPRLVREKRRFYQYMKVDMAHTVMLVERKVLSKRDGGRILKRLRELDGLGPERFRTDPKKGSFLLQVEDFLFDKLGEEIGGKMHTGRSRIDQGATVERLYTRDRLLDVVERLVDLQAVIIRVAARNSKAIMPGYTHMATRPAVGFRPLPDGFCRGAFRAFPKAYGGVRQDQHQSPGNGRALRDLLAPRPREDHAASWIRRTGGKRRGWEGKRTTGSRPSRCCPSSCLP